MKLTRKKLEAAVAEDILSAQQAEKLYAFLRADVSSGPVFDLTHVLYYLGGMIAIGAMSLFMTLGWSAFGAPGILIISLIYAGIGVSLSERFQKKGFAIPAGICVTFSVALTPLAIYALQLWLGLWPDDTAYRDYHRYIKWHWIIMELGTLAVAALAAYRYRYPFLQMPVAVTLWYMSMDVAVMFADIDSFQFRAAFSMYFGLAMIAFAVWADLRSGKSGDYAFWLYLFGVMAFWGGMTSQHSDSELSKLFYCVINVLLILVGATIVRRVFVVFGAIGVSFYLGHLANSVFEDSLLFPFALTLIGLAIIYLGILWQKHEQALTRRLRSYLPEMLRQLLVDKSS